MFQTITAFQMKLKLWQAQIKANNVMHFDTLAKHSPVNSEKYAALLFKLIKEFENRFQDFRENNQYFAILQLHFQSTKCYLPIFKQNAQSCNLTFNLKKNLIVSLHWTFIGRSYLPRDKFPLLHNHATFTSTVFGSTYICKQLPSRMKHINSKIRTKIS